MKHFYSMISDEQKLQYLSMQHSMYQQNVAPHFANYHHHPHHILLDQYKNATASYGRMAQPGAASLSPASTPDCDDIPSQNGRVEQLSKFAATVRSSPLDYVLSNLAGMGSSHAPTKQASKSSPNHQHQNQHQHSPFGKKLSYNSEQMDNDKQK